MNRLLRIFDDMAQCTEAGAARMLPLVSAQRREQALKFKLPFGRFACLKSYMMLRQCVDEALASPDQDLRPFQERLADWNGDFGYTGHGKPFMLDRSGLRIEGVDFSISHCRRAVAVALGDTPVGVDVESFREAGDSLLARTMNADELVQIRLADNPAEAFTRLWTRKEAVLKLRGVGLVDNLHDVLLPRPDCPPVALETTVNRERLYACTLAVERTPRRTLTSPPSC